MVSRPLHNLKAYWGTQRVFINVGYSYQYLPSQKLKLEKFKKYLSLINLEVTKTNPLYVNIGNVFNEKYYFSEQY